MTSDFIVCIYWCIYIYRYIGLHKKRIRVNDWGLRLVWFNKQLHIPRSRNINENLTDVSASQDISVPFTELARFITVFTTAHISRYPTSLYPISYLTSHAFRLHFNSINWFLHLTFPWLKLRMYFSPFTCITLLPAQRYVIIGWSVNSIYLCIYDSIIP